MPLLDFYFERSRALATDLSPWVGEYLWFPAAFTLALIALQRVLGTGLPMSIEKVKIVFRFISVVVAGALLVPEYLVASRRRKIANPKLSHSLYHYGDSVVWFESRFNDLIAWLASFVKPTRKFKGWVLACALVLLLSWNFNQCGGAVGTCETPLESWWFGSLWPMLMNLPGL